MVTRSSSRAIAGEEESVVLRAVWRARWLIAAGLVLGAVLGYTIGQQQPTKYTTHSRLVLGSSANFSPLGESSYQDPTRFVANQISILTSSPVLEEAIRLIEPTTSTTALRLAMDELSESVDASANGDSDVITIETTAPTAQLAKSRADAVATAYMNFTKQQVDAQTQQALDTTQDPARRTTMQTQAAIYGDGVAVFEPANLPLEPSAPRPLRNALILAVFGAVLAMGWALVRQARGSSASWRQTASDLGVPLLGEVPAPRGSGLDTSTAGALASRKDNPFQTMLISLDYLGPEPVSTVLVSGAVGRALTTAVARSLAVAAASQGRRVVLVSADPYSASSARENVDGDTVGRAGVQISLSATRLELIEGRLVSSRVSGPWHSAPVDLDLHSIVGRKGSAELERLRVNADLVVVDAPSLVSNPVGYALTGVVDAVVLLADDDTSAEDVALAEERITYAGSRLAGLVAILPSRRGLRRRRASRVQTSAVKPSSESPARIRERDDVPA